MGVNSLPKAVTRQCRGYDLNPGPSAPESSTLTTWLPSHPGAGEKYHNRFVRSKQLILCPRLQEALGNASIRPSVP